jgi:mRNA interferase MazF
MNKRDVWLTEIPFSDGHEQHGTRPAIVIAQPVANTVLIVPCTTNQKAATYKGTVLLEPNKTNGLAAKTVALVFQLRAIDAKRVQKRLGKLTATEYAAVKKAIDELIA